MNIIGCFVTHKTMGPGMIVERDENTIKVRFELPSGQIKHLRLQFPLAFKQGFLTTGDSILSQYVNDISNDRKCKICGKDDVFTEVIDGVRFCNSCRNDMTVICTHCQTRRDKNNLLELSDSKYAWQKTPICKLCADQKTFVCDKCGFRFHKNHVSELKFKESNLCKTCYSKSIKTCTYCGEQFDLGQGEYYPGYREPVYVCPECLPKHTFVCSECECRELLTRRAVSKFITPEMMLCDNCVNTCAGCGAEFEKKNSSKIFGKYYCTDCRENKMVDCPICGEEFVPEEVGQKVCPDCVEMKKYVSRLCERDLTSLAVKRMNYYDLDLEDRCEVFTQLYTHCRSKEGHTLYTPDSDPFHMIVMTFLGMQIVITYLSKEIVGKVLNARNVTMTEFRSKKGRFAVHASLTEWIENSETYLMTAAGKMKVLNYPVRLRVQTEFDKVYGKEWNGPDDYIEIGNYGDTTDFFIIGVLEND